MLKVALVRLSRGEGQPVYVIDTGFGGGKSFTLILLYHLFKNRHLAKEYIVEYGLDREYGILEPPQANVLAIDCRRLRIRYGGRLLLQSADMMKLKNTIKIECK
jgi:hypothetical protein